MGASYIFNDNNEHPEVYIMKMDNEDMDPLQDLWELENVTQG